MEGLGDGRVGRVERGVRGDAVLLRGVRPLEVDPAEEEVLELVVEALEVRAGPVDLGVTLGEGAGVPTWTRLAASSRMYSASASFSSSRW